MATTIRNYVGDVFITVSQSCVEDEPYGEATIVLELNNECTGHEINLNYSCLPKGCRLQVYKTKNTDRAAIAIDNVPLEEAIDFVQCFCGREIAPLPEDQWNVEETMSIDPELGWEKTYPARIRRVSWDCYY